MTLGAKRLRKMPPEKITIGDWLTHYREFFPGPGRTEKTAAEQARKVGMFVAAKGGRTLQSFTPLEAQDWTLKHAAMVPLLRHAWDRAVRMRIVEFNPWAGVELPPRTKPERAPPTLEQLDEILARARARGATDKWWLQYADLCEVAAFTGLRRQGLANLKRANVDLANERLTVTEKGARTRTVVVTGRGKDALASALARHPWTPYVFATRPPLAPLSEKWISERWLEIRGDFEHSFHSLRHFHATWLMANGVSREDIAVQLGHMDKQGRPRTQNVDRVYARPQTEQVLERIRAQLDGLKAGVT